MRQRRAEGGRSQGGEDEKKASVGTGNFLRKYHSLWSPGVIPSFSRLPLEKEDLTFKYLICIELTVALT